MRGVHGSVLDAGNVAGWLQVYAAVSGPRG